MPTTRVLVVDDDKDVRELLGRLVKSVGYEAIEAANGEQAIAAYRDRPADLVITDMYLPGSDGMDVIMRLLSEFPSARIVAISGGGAVDSVRVLDAAKHAGACRTLAKPFTMAALLKVIEDSLAEDQADPAANPSGA